MKSVMCDDCNGEGMYGCPTCNGDGNIFSTDADGKFYNEICQDCEGLGEITCMCCDGDGTFEIDNEDIGDEDNDNYC